MPDYGAGYGLMVLMPLTGRLIRHTLRLKAGQLLRSRIATLEHGLQRRGLRVTLLPRPNPATLLKRTALFHPLDDEALARLASQAEVVTLEAGRYLFRQGDPGESLYVIVRGTAEVVFEEGADSHTIDELGYGEAVGEMALLTGEPRNASIRAATLLTLVGIGQAALHELMQSGPDVREAIWSAFAARRFDNYLRGLRRFQHLRPETRRDWIAGRPQVVLEPGATFVPEPETAYVFLVTGEVEIEQNGAWVAMRAPALAECGASLRLHSLSATRLIALPARENEVS
ncbi:MAG: cyclic nucleotide-binding domain-containing protein [Bacteroidetes bacterium]|nr:cyclic nucleotide-binding domain-containing protein [Bacteroidota bacterium]